MVIQIAVVLLDTRCTAVAKSRRPIKVAATPVTRQRTGTTGTRCTSIKAEDVLVEGQCRRWNLTKDIVAECGRGNDSRARYAGQDHAQPFIVCEEKQLVLYDWAAR